MAFAHFHVDNRGHWLNAIDIDFLQLFDKSKDRIQFGLHAFRTLIGDGNT